MNAPTLCIRKALPEEAPELRRVAIRAYRHHYSGMWRDAGRTYLLRTYSEQQLAKELHDPALGYWLAVADGQALGFLCIRFDSALPRHVGAAEGLEIVRIYLVKEATGQGLGRSLMGKALDVARLRGKRRVWLKMMDFKPGVRRFYEALGFRVCGKTSLTEPGLREGYDGMLIMQKGL